VSRRILTSLLVSLVIALNSVSASAEIRVGVATEPYPPFTWKDSTGKWVGWEIDFLNAICREMKEKCTIVEISWDGLISSLNGHFIDLIWASMGINKERLQIIDFTDIYFDTPIVFIGTRNGDRDISPARLTGKAIGVQIGTMHQRNVEKHYSATSTIKLYQTQDEANQDLAAGRVDYVELDGYAAEAFLKTSQGVQCCEMKSEIAYDQDIFGGGVGGGIRKGDALLKAKLNAAIRAVRASGECEAISRRYFNLNICGS
jgi:polar amino acid transport system substrate-binding protein